MIIFNGVKAFNIPDSIKSIFVAKSGDKSAYCVYFDDGSGKLKALATNLLLDTALSIIRSIATKWGEGCSFIDISSMLKSVEEVD